MKFVFKGVYFGCYALCDAVYTYLKTFLSLVSKTKKKSFENTVLKMWSQKFTQKKLVLSLSVDKDYECFYDF